MPSNILPSNLLLSVVALYIDGDEVVALYIYMGIGSVMLRL